jgi:hypothetical protein
MADQTNNFATAFNEKKRTLAYDDWVAFYKWYNEKEKEGIVGRKKNQMNNVDACKKWLWETNKPAELLPSANVISKKLTTIKKQMQEKESNASMQQFSCGCIHRSSLVKFVKNEFKIPDRATDKAGYCPTCNLKEYIKDHNTQSQMYLRRLIEANQTMNVQWPNAKETISPVVHLYSRLGLARNHSLWRSPAFNQFAHTPFSVSRMDFPAMSKEASKEMARKSHGSYHPHIAGNSNKQDTTDVFGGYGANQVLMPPCDGSYGIAVIPNSNWQPSKPIEHRRPYDYAILGPSHMSSETIVKVSTKEMPSILRQDKCPRRGGAGGYFDPTIKYVYDTKSLSMCTKAGRIFFKDTEASYSNAIKCAYWNADTKKHESHSGIVPDIYMNRVTGKQKWQECADSYFQRDRMIKEMESRVRALCIVDHYKLHTHGKSHEIFKTLTQSVIRVYSENSAVLKWWKALLPGIDDWHVVLLEYACRTGEMRNHQAVAVHTDGNVSHFLETMVLYGRTLQGNYGNTYDTIVRGFTPGYLYLLQFGIALGFRCGIDICHLQLSETLHVPDRSRDVTNWSAVHGP